MSDLRILLLGMTALLRTLVWACPCMADDLQVFYVPYVSAFGGGTPDRFTKWESSLGLYNNSDSVASVGIAAVYGKGGWEGGCPLGPLAPHTGTGRLPDPCANGPIGVELGILAVKASPGIVVRSDVQRVVYRCECDGPGCMSYPEGEVATPVYWALFPAGRTAVSGAVELGYFGASPTCGKEYRRRVNVTLFNAGIGPSTFVVKVIPFRSSSTPLYESQVSVGAKDVVQINSIAVPTEPSDALLYGDGGGVGYRVWITITADQPFLSYVSTIFDDPEPGALPFEVYPSYLQN